MITALLTNYLLPALAVIVALFSAWSVGKSSARAKAAEQRQADNEALAARLVNEQRAANEREVQTVKATNDVQKDNAGLSDSDADKRLRGEWQRD